MGLLGESTNKSAVELSLQLGDKLNDEGDLFRVWLELDPWDVTEMSPLLDVTRFKQFVIVGDVLPRDNVCWWSLDSYWFWFNWLMWWFLCRDGVEDCVGVVVKSVDVGSKLGMGWLSGFIKDWLGGCEPLNICGNDWSSCWLDPFANKVDKAAGFKRLGAILPLLGGPKKIPNYYIRFWPCLFAKGILNYLHYLTG